MDLYTLGGGPSESRASLMANKGFVVLALAFYRYKDLPKTIDQLDLEYFEEGVHFLQQQPKVSINIKNTVPHHNIMDNKCNFSI